jgi:hypothetical protein
VKKLRFTINGAAPLLMHSGRLADGADPYVLKMKEITSRRNKTDADHEELARLEFLGGLYLNDANEPVIPGAVMEACIIGRGGSARMERSGKEASAALWVVEDMPLLYDGPKAPDAMWKDKRFVSQAMVRIQRATVKRTRPIFHDWSADVTVEFNEKLLNEDDVRRWVEVAGEQVGLMDWRPRFGRFTVAWTD